MSAYWIPYSINLPQKPKTIRMAKNAGIHPNEMATRCMIAWAWAQDQTVDGFIEGLTPEDLSAAVGIPGLGEAMQSVGWIIQTEEGITFPKWERYNGRAAKKRMLDAERKRRQRRRKSESL